MNFFEAQAHAKKRTGRLLLLFALAVIGISAAAYFVVTPCMIVVDAAAYEEEATFWNFKYALVTLGVVAVIVGGGSLSKWLSLRKGGVAVAQMLGGRHITGVTDSLKEKQLVNVVEEMAIASGLPVPPVFVLDGEPGINAFAAGQTVSDAVVAVSEGALKNLSRDELQAVVGHEFSHILNGDMRLNLRLTATVYGILLFEIIGRMLVNSGVESVSTFHRKKGGDFLIIVFGIVLMILGGIGYFFGRMIQAAVSRQREFLADAAAVQFTRNPDAMTSALNKIRMRSIGSEMRNAHAAEVSHFFFAKATPSILFTTHPPVEKRILAINPNYVLTTFSRPAPSPPEKASLVTTTGSRRKPPRPPIRNAQTVTHFLASIGSVDTEKIERAQILIDQFPVTLHHAAQDPSQAGALILALLLDAEKSVREKQIAALADAVTRSHCSTESVTLLFSALQEIDPLQRLPLFQIALGALHPFSDEQRNALLATAEKLAVTDGRTSIFEYALLRMLKHHLGNIRNPNKARRRVYHSRAKLAASLSVVLSFVTYAGKSATLRHSVIFAAGARTLADFFDLLKIVPVTECNFGALDDALATLEGASPALVENALQAAAVCAGSDGEIHSDEAELIRAIAFSFDCPVPVFA